MMERRGTPYRLATPDASAPSQVAGDLEELRRSRLRVAVGLATFTAGGLGVATLVSNLPHILLAPSVLFTAPPFAGPMLFMAVVMAGAWFALRPGRQWSLARLNLVEWLMICAWAAFFVVIITLDLRGLLTEVTHVPIDLAMAHSSMWGIVSVASAVLLPSTPRHGMQRSAVIFCCNWIPDLILVLSDAPLPPKFGIYVGTMGVMSLFYAAIATYGGYRIEALRRDAQRARQLGQYLLTSPLGSGGMGEVYLAEHTLLRRPCAVKLIRPEQAGDEATLRRFEREARATAALTHPNTVQVYDYGIADDGTFYYVMEYLTGTTLEELLTREGRQPPDRVYRILSQLCGALDEAHANGLVHRDIKPGNVILGERGGVTDVAKLLDFGLVGTVRRESQPADRDADEEGLIVGTPDFMSPEQCGGDLPIGPASDIYSLGALSFALLVGEPPFGRRAPMQLLAAHLMEAPPRVDIVRPEVPTVVADAIARCLAKDPRERFPTAGALATAIGSAFPDRGAIDGSAATARR